MKKVIAGLLFLVSFSSLGFGEIRSEELRTWAPMEFTYKTGSSAPGCQDGFNASERELYDLSLRLKEEPELYMEIMDELYKYVEISPVAMSFYIFNLPELYESIAPDLKEMLPLTENYPALASFILMHLLTMDAADPVQYTDAGEVYCKSIHSISNYKDYICELKHRDCFDMTQMLNIRCDGEH